jgi:hypothetical protein
VAAARLVQASQPLSDVASLDDAVKLLNAIGGVPLPLGMLAQDLATVRTPSPHLDERTKTEPLALTVAFLKFQIDSVDVQYIQASTADPGSAMTPAPMFLRDVPVSASGFPVPRAARCCLTLYHQTSLPLATVRGASFTDIDVDQRPADRLTVQSSAISGAAAEVKYP